MTLPPCKRCGGTGLGPAAGADLKALRMKAGVSVTAAAAGMEVCRAWVVKVESGKARAPEKFAAYYAHHFGQDEAKTSGRT